MIEVSLVKSIGIHTKPKYKVWWVTSTKERTYMGDIENEVFNYRYTGNYNKITDDFIIEDSLLRYPDGHPEVKFERIDIKLNSKTYSTTRKYWLSHCGPSHYALWSYLSRPLFGINFAKAWEAFDEVKPFLRKYTIFEVWNDSEKYNYYMGALEILDKFYSMCRKKESKYHIKIGDYYV